MEQQYFKISDFADRVGKHINTVDGWFKKLEEQYIHYVNRVHKEKVYDELDLQIALFIKQQRERKWAIEAIFDDLSNHFDLRSFPDDVESPKRQLVDIEAIKRKITSEVAATMEELLDSRIEEVRKEYETKLALLPKPDTKEEEKQKRINDLLTKRKVEQKLEEDAIKLWETKPEMDRVKRVGLFRKEEDLLKREAFIKKHINDHIKEQLLKEYI